jgi:hypothetical protein
MFITSSPSTLKGPWPLHRPATWQRLSLTEPHAAAALVPCSKAESRRDGLARDPAYPTVLALKSGYYYLNGERAILILLSDDMRILAYDKIRGD